jgi:agmatinase
MKPEDINFGFLPDEFSNYNDSRVVILPVAYDQTSTWIKGADDGPDAIIEASANMELYDIETDFEAYKAGICTDTTLEIDDPPAIMVDIVNSRVRDYLEDDKFVVTVGGEHSVSIGAIGAHAKKYPEMTVLQFDAHADLRMNYNGSKYNHACVMARVAEMCPFVQVGIRGMSQEEKDSIDRMNIFRASDIAGHDGWYEQVVSNLGEDVYITFDLDVLDPSIMPSTGTPEPGGLGWYEVLGLLKKVIENRNLVGFDVTELCPNKNNHAPDFLAAKLIYKMLSYKYARQL